MTATGSLEVLDHGEPLTIFYEDLVKYHGRSSIGGVALGFKVMERAFPLLDGGRAPERYDVTVDTAFAGPGTRDALEMVTRAVTGGRYTVDLTLRPDAPEAPDGRFSFRFGYRSNAVELVLRPGLVSNEFIAMARRPDRSPTDEVRLTGMKEELAALLMSRPAHDVFEAGDVRSRTGG